MIAKEQTAYSKIFVLCASKTSRNFELVIILLTALW